MKEIEALGKPMEYECSSDSSDGICNSISYHGAIVRTGPFSFVLASEDRCDQLIDPISSRKITNEQPKENCRPYCHAKGIDDPKFFSSFCETSWFDREKFVTETGFLGWELVNSGHYYSVPERDKSSVCQKSGLKPDCFATPTYETLVEYQKNPSLNTDYPFTNAFLSKYGYNEPKRLQLANALRDREDFRLQWEDAYSKDLFLKSGTSITKQVQDDWIIYRVEWDPSLFCKYEKSASDLYTH